MSKIICVDFDGVIHSYKSGWHGVYCIDDPPVEGAIEWLTDLVQDERFEVCIYSSRSRMIDGIKSMCEWLLEWGMTDEVLEEIEFPTQKPAAWLTIDDRAICFQGTFPSFEEMENFKPWNKK